MTDEKLSKKSDSKEDLAASISQDKKTDVVPKDAIATKKVDDQKTEDKKLEDKKSEDKKADSKKPEEKKSEEKKPDDKKADEKPKLVVPAGPSFDELAARILEETEILKNQGLVKPVTDKEDEDKKKDEKKEEKKVIGNLDEIASSVQQRNRLDAIRSVEYKLPQVEQPHLRSVYNNQNDHLDPLKSLYSGLQKEHADKQYASMLEKERALHGAGVSKYERESLQRDLGRTAADELIEQHEKRLHGDKGIFSTYNRHR